LRAAVAIRAVDDIQRTAVAVCRGHAIVHARLERLGGSEGLHALPVTALRHLAASLLTLHAAALDALQHHSGSDSARSAFPHDDGAAASERPQLPAAGWDRLRVQAADLHAWLVSVNSAIDDRVAAALLAARPAAPTARVQLSVPNPPAVASTVREGADVDVDAYMAAVAAAKPQLRAAQVVPYEQPSLHLAAGTAVSAAAPPPTKSAAGERAALLGGSVQPTRDGDAVAEASAAERARADDVAGSLTHLAAALKVQALSLHDRLRADVAVLEATDSVAHANLATAAGLNAALSGPGGPAEAHGWGFGGMGAALAGLCEVVGLVLVAGVVWAGAYVVIKLT
jgi:hypothetical protein